MKVERYIREYAASILRDKAATEQTRSNIEITLASRERGIITASEAMQMLFLTAFNPSQRLQLASVSVYYDCEHDELVTLDQLQQEWNGMTEDEREERGGGSFDDFIEACMVRNNGVLIHFSEWIEHRLKH